jgi:hypothetical protein
LMGAGGIFTNHQHFVRARDWNHEYGTAAGAAQALVFGFDTIGKAQAQSFDMKDAALCDRFLVENFRLLAHEVLAAMEQVFYPA